MHSDHTHNILQLQFNCYYIHDYTVYSARRSMMSYNLDTSPLQAKWKQYCCSDKDGSFEMVSLQQFHGVIYDNMIYMIYKEVERTHDEHYVYGYTLKIGCFDLMTKQFYESHKKLPQNFYGKYDFEAGIEKSLERI